MKKSSRGEEGIQRVRGLKPWRWRFFRNNNVYNGNNCARPALAGKYAEIR